MKKRLLSILNLKEYDEVRDEILLLLQKYYADELLKELEKIHFSYNFHDQYKHIDSDNFTNVRSILESMVY